MLNHHLAEIKKAAEAVKNAPLLQKAAAAETLGDKTLEYCEAVASELEKLDKRITEQEFQIQELGLEVSQL